MAGDPDHPTASAASLLNVATRRFQVLALDGGGAKALFTAHVLARLEDDLDVRVSDSFDLLAGTSAGGIIALALGAGMKPADVVTRYTDLTRKVFPTLRRSPARFVSRAVAPAYSGVVLREVLSEVLGTRLLGDSEKRLVIPSWDVQRGDVHLSKTPHHPRLNRDWRIPMVDVAMATTAAPSYFPAAQVDGQRLIDGGVWANNPSLLAISEAVSMLGVPLDAIRVLNIGTVDQRAAHPERLDTGGWATRAVSLITTAVSRGTQGTSQHLVGKDDFVRFDASLPGNTLTLDQASPAVLAGLAAGASRSLSPAYTEKFADHQASPYTPYRRPGAAPTLPGGTP